MSPPHPFDSFPIQSLNRQSEFPGQRLFKHWEWAIAGEDNLSHIHARMMLAACTQRHRTFLNNVVDQFSTKDFFTL
jgi:hypothetical protein